MKNNFKEKGKKKSKVDSDTGVKWQLQTWWHKEYLNKPTAQSNQFLKLNHVYFQAQQIKPLFE